RAITSICFPQVLLSVRFITFFLRIRVLAEGLLKGVSCTNDAIAENVHPLRQHSCSRHSLSADAAGFKEKPYSIECGKRTFSMTYGLAA
ncbi:MAG: hypothetical protein AAFN38_11555, partial [Cyanobacteria bacterium J06560_5]